VTPQTWPIFICYRRVDGSAAARRLHETLDKCETAGPDGAPIRIDAYLDASVPGIADWKAVHRPYLEKARALIVVCTPGLKLNEGAADWVHQEIDWWMTHRTAAPILIDPLREGIRYVPVQIASKWPDIQRIQLVEEEWGRLSGSALELKTQDLRRQIIGTLLPSGADVYAQELTAERLRANRLKMAFTVSTGLLVAAAALGTYAWNRRGAAIRNEQVARASLLDTQAAAFFDESRLWDARREIEVGRRLDLLERLNQPDLGATRQDNLRHELAQLDADIDELDSSSKAALNSGRDSLKASDQAWQALGSGLAGVERRRPEPPYVFSIELLNAGHGESILLHYGPVDDVRIVMINTGPGRTYKTTVEPRLRQLSQSRFNGDAVSIELLVIGDRDEDKTGGLNRMLRDLSEETGPRLVNIRGIWANIFRAEGTAETFRTRLRRMIDDLQIPLNKPFDRHVVRPDRGRAIVTLPGGLDITVLGPTPGHIAQLHKMSERELKGRDAVLEPLLEETFRAVTVRRDPAPLIEPAEVHATKDSCVPSENARQRATSSYTDRSVSNLSSVMLVFQFRGSTFLFTADGRGDLLLDGLERAGMLDGNGKARVDLMTIPHLGSHHNVTVDFFRKVRARGYFFSGDGRHNNPEIATVASLITARECDEYRMYFVNREGGTSTTDRQEPADAEETPDEEQEKAPASDPHGARLDEFFKAEQPFNPNYRRVFRSATGGSVIIDLLNPVRD
jgi:beta-lactamase superfamily II metal-dependent hydrolase